MFKVKCERKDGGLTSELKPKKLCPFHPKSVWARGLCKSCYDGWLKKNNPEYARKQKEHTSQWMKSHREYRRKYEKNWVAKQDPLYGRIKGLKRYGMTLNDYSEMLQKQNGVCAICNNPPKPGKNLHIDHNHETGFVRGLLCFWCNFGLSYFKEDVNIAKNLYEYLQK